ncbi:MAG: hypothetical protein CMM07_24010 [Rhodopirellula sp.]|nr:hypothetical protein [Rhodopirellula sp.]
MEPTDLFNAWMPDVSEIKFGVLPLETVEEFQEWGGVVSGEGFTWKCPSRAAIVEICTALAETP